MTSDLGDSKEVSEDLEQCQFEVDSTSKVKPSSQALNPNADVFYSTSSNPSASLEEENIPLVKGEDSFLHDESSEPKSEPMPTNMNTEKVEAPQASGQPVVGYDFDNSLVHDGQQGGYEEPMNYEMKQQIRHALRTQLEYYFSRENLAKDSYLLSQMDSDQYVSIATIANFNQVRNLTRDMDFIVEVLRESPHVQVDEAGEKVRPCHKRCVIILREIPESTPVKEIEDLFKNERCPNYVSCEFAHNNNWYVNFETDEDAQLAYKYLREEVKTFQGKTIMARIKAKPNTRDSFLQPYKNGIRPPTPVDTGFPQNQQRLFSTVSYGNNAQVCPQMLGAPFYSPTLLQTWGPTTGHQPYLDLGAVFTVNGLSPQASYKPVANTGRLNFSMVRGSRSGKQHYSGGGGRQQQQSYEVEHGSRYERNQSLAYIRPPPPTALINGAGGYTYMPYPAYPSSRAGPYPFGIDVPEYCYPKRLDGHSSLYPSYSQLQSAPRTMTKLEDSTKLAQSDPIFSLQQPRLNRSRRRKREDGILGNKPNEGESKSGESPKFDLEPAAFPPLPGAEDAEAFDNRLAEVVKGTGKLSTSDAKSPESLKELPIIGMEAVVTPPPSSPVICCDPPGEARSHQSAKCESSSSPSKGRQQPAMVPEDGTEDTGSTLNGHNDSDSPNFSEDERLSTSRRLTYSEVAQRSKSKVEKLSVEGKERAAKCAPRGPPAKNRYVAEAPRATGKKDAAPDPKGSRPTCEPTKPPPIK